MGCQTVLRLGAAGLVTPAESQHGNKNPYICVRRCFTKSIYTKIVPIYGTYVAVAKPSLCQALSLWQRVTWVVIGLAPAPFRSTNTSKCFYNSCHIDSFTNMHPYAVGKDYEIVYSDTDAMSLSRMSILASVGHADQWINWYNWRCYRSHSVPFSCNNFLIAAHCQPAHIWTEHQELVQLKLTRNIGK